LRIRVEDARLSLSSRKRGRAGHSAPRFSNTAFLVADIDYT